MLTVMKQKTRKLQRYIRRYFPSWIDAKDVVQEAYLRAWKHYGTIELPFTRLRTIARNIAINECQKSNRPDRLVGDVEYRRERTLPQWPMELLTNDQRQVTELRFWEGLSERAAATRLCISRYSVREIQLAAYATLRAASDSSDAAF